MKNICFILLIFIAFAFVKQTSYAQFDTLATVSIENAILTQQDKFEFDLWLYRMSDKWYFWANGTFQFTMPNITDYKDLKIDMIDGSSDLALITTGLPVYNIMTAPLEDRIQFVILGPEDVVDSKGVPYLDRVRIGRFVISSKSNKKLPDNIFWKLPLEYYQACAFKLSEDDPAPENFFEPKVSDNIELSRGRTFTVGYKSESEQKPTNVLNYFTVDYEGVLSNKLSIGMQSEYKNLGFIVRRGLKTLEGNLESLPEEMFTDEIASYKKMPYDLLLKGAYTSLNPVNYVPFYDTVTYRNAVYCYRLYYHDDDKGIVQLATREVKIPNAVISKASAAPNPFSYTTVINYKIEDNVYLTATVYDQIGREVTKLNDDKMGLLERKVMPPGNYTCTFTAPHLATQGMYDIIFIAYPINDPSIEISRAVVKVQLVKDGNK